MTILYTLLMLVLLAFAGLQYNDPDFIFWAIIYLVPAIALGLAAFLPHLFATLLGRILLFLAVVVLAFGVYVYWPTELTAVGASDWWKSEEVKEGFGVAVAYLFLCLTIPLAFRRSIRRLKKRKVDD